MIIYTADNGLALGSHGLLGKQNLYEHSTKVPLIISGPGIPKGQTSEALVYLFDLFPTLVDYLEYPMPEFPEDSALGEPDLIFEMEESHFIEGNYEDDYRCFVFSLDNEE